MSIDADRRWLGRHFVVSPQSTQRRCRGIVSGSAAAIASITALITIIT